MSVRVSLLRLNALFFTIVLFAQKYKWSSVNCQGRFYLIKIILRLTNFTSCGGWGGLIALLQVGLCYRNQDLLWPHWTVRVIWCQEIMAKIRWFLLWESESESETFNFKFNIFIFNYSKVFTVQWHDWYFIWDGGCIQTDQTWTGVRPVLNWPSC